ncbi:MAG: hypothetical protein GX653_05745 [Clostridiales bacterium]|nr:hypothetical protein [Clostridiales bacterium]
MMKKKTSCLLAILLTCFVFAPTNAVTFDSIKEKKSDIPKATLKEAVYFDPFCNKFSTFMHGWDGYWDTNKAFVLKEDDGTSSIVEVDGVVFEVLSNEEHEIVRGGDP